MLMAKSVKIVSLSRAEEQDFQYWLKKSPTEKLDTLQYLREIGYDLKHEDRKGLQRFLKVTRRKRS
jgi:predicted solute-binding protein